MLYFDEAGYTGPDLTNKEQPYFALASIRMTDDEVACGENGAFPPTRDDCIHSLSMRERD